MDQFRKWLFMAALLPLFASCIQDEPLNVEAAIDDCSVQGMTSQASIDNTQRTVRIDVSKGLDMSQVKVTFKLPAGATYRATDSKTADRPSESVYDFSEKTMPAAVHIRRFTITSEDGSQQATYQLALNPSSKLIKKFQFEEMEMHVNSQGKEDYQVLVENPGSEDELRWASGNPGFALTMMAKTPTDYPTFQIDDGYEGRAVRLVTRNTGSFGAMVKMYMASGNLFIGSFDLGNALSNALKATKFGRTCYQRPSKLNGYYRYRAGDTYMEKNVENPNKRDRFNIYAIFYEAATSDFTLDGSNAFTDPSLVSVARIEASDAVESSTWRRFSIRFEPVNDKVVDPAKLEAGGYKLGIVFASSVEGDLFNGAVDSTLDIDEVEVVYENNEE